MLNKEDFFSDFGIFLKEEASLDWNRIAHYLEIIDQYPNYINYIIGESTHNNMEYIPAVDDGWNATDGSVVIGECIIELCCYASTFAINLYKNEELLEMLSFSDILDTNRQIESINAQIQDLLAEKESLLNNLKQMA